jgi:hypothetical protein
MAEYKDNWTKQIGGKELSFSSLGDIPLSETDKRIAALNAEDDLKKGLERNIYASFAGNQNVAWEIANKNSQGTI